MRSLYTVGADSAYQPHFETDEEDIAETQLLVSSPPQRRRTGQTVKLGRLVGTPCLYHLTETGLE